MAPEATARRMVRLGKGCRTARASPVRLNAAVELSLLSLGQRQNLRGVPRLSNPVPYVRAFQ